MNDRAKSPGRWLLVLAALGMGQGPDPPQDRWERLRERMTTEQIEERGVTNAHVLRVMRETPRHLFVPPHLETRAYDDGPLPIGHGQTISQPYIVAYMTELLEPSKEQMVLEIGAGSGYQAAVLSPLVRHVYTIEIVADLAKEAAERLKRLGYTNVTVRAGDGYQGWPEHAPFDRIIITAAPESIPPRLVEQLKPGGVMVLPMGPAWLGQDLIILEKLSNGRIKTRRTIPVRFVPMVHSPPP